MPRSLKSILDELPPQRRAWVDDKAQEMADDMVRYASTLAEARRAMEKTQTEVADVLQIKQNAVTQLEKRSDMLLSTLRKYVAAMGAELQLSIRTAAGVTIILEGMGTLTADTATTASATAQSPERAKPSKKRR